MTIDPKNIDQWLFNYYEGNLSPSEVKQLKSFLKKNPDYYEDAHAWKDSFVEEAVPVFNASFLVKEIDTKADRKRFAFAMFALLLIGSFSALYLASTNSTGSTTNNNSTTTDKTNTKNNTVANNNNKPKTTNYSTNTNTTTYSTPGANNPTNTNVVRNTPVVQVNPNTNPNPVNTHVSNVNNTHVNNVLAHRTSTNNVTISNPPTYVAPINGNSNISLVTSNANTTIATNTNLVNSNPVNSQVLNTTSIIAPDPLATNNAVVIETPNAFNPEPIIVNNELVVVNTESVENINMTLGEPVPNNGKELEVTSEFNPNKFDADKKADDPNKSSNEVAVDNNKKDIQTENGIRFGNLRNVSLLQGINSEFQTNGSFITQHYSNDGYLAFNYRGTSSSEFSTNMMAGISYSIRKYRATINVYGHRTASNTYTNIGGGLQAALNLKLDRFNFLVPSMTVTFDRYSFSGLYDNGLPSIALPGKSYFSRELTGKSTIPDYINATHVNVSTGLVYHHKKYYLGVAFNGLLQPKFRYTTETSSREQFATNAATVNIIAGTDFISKKYPEFSVGPQAIVEIHNMEPVVTGGTVFKYKSLAAGLGVSSKGALNTYFGFSNRTIGLQYRFMFDKVDPTFGNLSGHYMTFHINLKGLSKKQKTYLDDDK